MKNIEIQLKKILINLDKKIIKLLLKKGNYKKKLKK